MQATGAKVCVNCPGDEVPNANCQCAGTCPSPNVFCNGCCFNPSTACQGLHNKNFNAQCCSCENPGQPSGRCKSDPLTCDT